MGAEIVNTFEDHTCRKGNIFRDKEMHRSGLVMVILLSVNSLPPPSDSILKADCWYNGTYHPPGTKILSTSDTAANCSWWKICRDDGEVIDEDQGCRPNVGEEYWQPLD